MSANESTPTWEKQYTSHGDKPSPPTPQQAKKKIKNKKGGGGSGGGGGPQTSTTHSANSYFSSSFSSFFHHQAKVESHSDALRKHLGAKTFKKLIDTYATAARFLSISSLTFFFLTLSTLPADATTVTYLPNIIYFPFIRWWYLRLWLGVSLWSFVATRSLEWTLFNIVLPLIFASYAPSKLSECIQDAVNINNNNNNNINTAGEQDATDDPSDAFVKSAPLDNGSKYTYSSLTKLLQWHHHGAEDAPRIFSNIVNVSRFAADLWLLSFATGGGWMWLGAAMLYGAMMFYFLCIAEAPTRSVPGTPFFFLFAAKRVLPLVGAVRIGAQLLLNAVKLGYAKYICSEDVAVCVNATVAPTGSWYKGSDVEVIFHVLFREYSLLGVLLVTPSLIFVSYLLSKIKSKHLPRWWWAVSPKREVVAACLYAAQCIVSVAWIPATQWVTDYTIEFLAGKENNKKKKIEVSTQKN